MRRLQGLYVLDRPIYELVYGSEVQQAIARHVEMIAPPQTRQSIAEHPDLLADLEVLFSGWGGLTLDERFFETAQNVRAVFHAGGAPRLPENAARRGVVMTSAHYANSIPVAEYALATILFSLKHGWHLIHQTRKQQTFPPRDGAPGCYGRTVGIIALGSIARLLLRLLEPFDLRVIAYDPFVTQADASALNVELVSLEDIFNCSDVVTLHAPHTSETEGMITGRHLAAMRQGATFINTARGALVCENELIEVASTRPDLQFVLDVTHPEPPVSGSPLYTLPNVVVTPHIAGSAGGECRRMGDFLVEELERFVAGQPLLWAVPNPLVPGRPTASLLLNSAPAVRPRVTIASDIRQQIRANGPQVESLHAQ
jgi:phosphoglycerate dehydrogenase-like enzyme